MSYSLIHGFVGEGQIEENQAYIDHSTSKRRSTAGKGLVKQERPVAVYFGYTSGILLGRCDRSNGRQSERLEPNQPIFSPLPHFPHIRPIPLAQTSLTLLAQYPVTNTQNPVPSTPS